MRRIYFGMIVCLFTLLMGISIGCGSSEGVTAVDVAKMVPGQVDGFQYMDLQFLRDDDDLANFVSQWVENVWEYNAAQYKAGLPVSDVDWWVQAYDYYGYVEIYGGEFDLTGVREELVREYYKDEFKGIEVWTDDYTSVAIVDSRIIVGDTYIVEECIDTIRSTGSSMYDEDDVAEVLSKLPDGWLINVNATSVLYGEEVTGMTLRKTTPETFELYMILGFENDENAEDALNEVQEYLLEVWIEESEPNEFSAYREGRFVEIRAEWGIDALIEPTPSEADSYETDLEVIQLAAVTFYSDVHSGWSGGTDADTGTPDDNRWGANTTAEDPGHYYPTALAVVGDHNLRLSDSEFDPMNRNNPRINGEYGAATEQEISWHAVWMGLLVNFRGEYVSSLGTTDRGCVSVLKGETCRYLEDFSESAMAGNDRNGVPAPGGSYCWVVGANGAVYGAYEGSDGYWYAGFSGSYP